MSNFYHKVAVAFACTALSCALGANKEAKAATFTVPTTFTAQFRNYGLSNGLKSEVDPSPSIGITFISKGTLGEDAQLNEFNIGRFSFAPNTIITKAVVQVKILSVYSDENGTPSLGSLGIFGYVGNGKAETSDFEAGVFLSSVNVLSSDVGDILNFDVTPFVNQRVNNRDAFAGFVIRALNLGTLALNNQRLSKSPMGLEPNLILETADVTEPVPEPATIFGSVIGLCLGGWLKRRKSALQNKTTSQN